MLNKQAAVNYLLHKATKRFDPAKIKPCKKTFIEGLELNPGYAELEFLVGSDKSAHAEMIIFDERLIK